MRAVDLLLARGVLATIWIVTGILSLGVFSQRESLGLLEQVGLHGAAAQVALYGAASLDILLGVLTMAKPSRPLWLVQAVLVVSYSAIIAFRLPQYLLHPFGPVLKNLAILMLLWILYEYEEKIP